MEAYKNLKKGTKIGLIICQILVFVGVAFNIVSLINHISNGNDIFGPILQDFINLLIYAFILIYDFVGYKKPHGNMMRALFFAFGINMIIGVIIPKPEYGTIEMIASFVNSLGALFVAFVAGRLNRIEQNRKLLIIAGALMAVGSVLAVVNLSAVGREFDIRRVINVCEPIIALAALGVGYAARYEEHKDAGLDDGK
ncbi:MAG: hypothetical protein MJ101_03855 [Clostridia bacterium]|nr:hypothetical protein [Clostridia bacterium]